MPSDATSTMRGAEDRSLEAGLDALQTDVGTRRRSLGHRLRWSLLPPVVTLALLVLAWQSLVWAQVKPRYTLPSPLDVASTMGGLVSDGTALHTMATSLERGVLGFIAAAVIGTPLGMVVARVRVVRAGLGPLITALQVLPSVAWVPAAVLWFGISDATLYFVILLGAVPSIANGLVSGVDQVPPLLRRVGTVLGAGRWQMVRHVILPAAMPGYIAGLRQGWAFSWRSLMAAELIAVGGSLGLGVGGLLDQGRQLADIGVVTCAIVLILLVGILVELVFFAPVERRILHARGLAAETSAGGR